VRRQKYLVSGKRVSLRLWENVPPRGARAAVARDYETVGYVIAGRAALFCAGQKIILEPGDSWVVPRGVVHRYQILEPFTAVEAAARPAECHEPAGVAGPEQD
jgi:mannose-6-phosphate isomerase-like protein (cupin superfamily)